MGILDRIRLAITSRHQKPRNRILVILDFENILLNINVLEVDPRSFSLTNHFDNLMRKLGEIGQVAKVFVYGPPEVLDRHSRLTSDLGFTTVQCPKQIIKKAGLKTGKVDTVDHRIIEDGNFLLKEMPGITHFCLGSGDGDFVGLLREARWNQKKVIIVVGSEKSLSPDLAEFACRDSTGKKAIYILSQVEDSL